jgi:hypothetical protein
MFAHSWALKYWRLKDELTLSRFVSQGFEIIFEGISTPKGRRRFALLDVGKPPARGSASRASASP